MNPYTVDLRRRVDDVASAYNVDSTEVLEAVRAAIRGNYHPIAAYGVNLTDAMVSAEAERFDPVDVIAKGHATLALVMQQTAKWHGDFDRCSG